MASEVDSPRLFIRFDETLGASGAALGALCPSTTENSAIFCTFPLSSTVKSSLVKLRTGVLSSKTTTSSSTRRVPTRKVGCTGAPVCAMANPARHDSESHFDMVGTSSFLTSLILLQIYPGGGAA